MKHFPDWLKAYFFSLRPYAAHFDAANYLNLLARRLADSREKQIFTWYQQRPRLKTEYYSIESGSVVLGKAEEVSHETRLSLEQYLRDLGPWKKGPFKLFGIEIDSQWQSQIKWDRLRVALELNDLSGKKVADVGCHNGYFLWRLAELRPDLVLGIEPALAHFAAFSLMRSFLHRPPTCLGFSPCGSQILEVFPRFFDLIFCLGVIYHSKSPLEVLTQCRLALAPKGRLVLDTLILPEDSQEGLSFSPDKRYAGIGGVWHVPSEKALEIWVRRSGFSNFERIYMGRQDASEQRATDWCPQEGQSSFINKDNPARTTEGHRTPLRAYYLCF